MDCTVGQLLCFTAAIGVVLYWLFPSSRRLPPCPRVPLPILGHLPYLSSDLRKQFKKWREQCGDVFRLHMGTSMAVVISGYDLIKETFNPKVDKFIDRLVPLFDEFVGLKEKGVVFASGKLWKEQRTVALNILKKFGVGKNVLAERIVEEASHYVAHLSSYGQSPVDISKITNMATGNMVSSILIGQRFEYTDTEFLSFINDIYTFFRITQQVSVLHAFPFLRHVPTNVFHAKDIDSNLQAIYRHVRRFIEMGRSRPADDNFIAAYLAEGQARRKAGDDTTLDDVNLTKVIFDLFLGGTEPTANTMYWCVLYVLNHPDVQANIYDEICGHIGTERAPNIQDKPSLTYLSAVVMETQRLASIFPHCVGRCSRKDEVVRDYVVPKGTLVLANLDSVMFDEAIWGSEVMSFRPERFIDEDGRLKNSEAFLPFGVGRRVCPGETMAKTELFLFLASMFQKFEILPVNPKSPPPMNYNFSLITGPNPYQVILKSRINN
ncbi:cytochrome P450 2 sub U member 1 [Bulinus truncatus]|nr:cytochrome P450 2 sub U member 1 [Bulinus truncatus]